MTSKDGIFDPVYLILQPCWVALGYQYDWTNGTYPNGHNDKTGKKGNTNTDTNFSLTSQIFYLLASQIFRKTGNTNTDRNFSLASQIFYSLTSQIFRKTGNTTTDTNFSPLVKYFIYLLVKYFIYLLVKYSGRLGILPLMQIFIKFVSMLVFPVITLIQISACTSPPS